MVRKKAGKKIAVVLISIRAFSRQINTSEGAVRKAIKEGKFSQGYDPELKKIDPAAAANNAWVKQQMIPKAKAGVSKQKALAKRNGAAAASAADPALPSVNLPGIPIATGEEMNTEDLLALLKITKDLTYNDSTRYRELIALALDKKKLQEAEGLLVSREKVEKALHALGSELKKALMNIPQRVVRKIKQAETEVDGINILIEAMSQVLSHYGNLRPSSLN